MSYDEPMIYVLVFSIIAAFIGGLMYLDRKGKARTFKSATVDLDPTLHLISGRPDKPYRWLGEFEGRPVRIVFNSRTKRNNQTDYWVELIMTFPPGGESWSIHYHTRSMLSRGPDGWVIDTKHNRTRQALEQSGALRMAETVSPGYRFDRDGKTGDLRVIRALAGGYNFQLDPAVIEALLVTLRDLDQAYERALHTPSPAALA